MVCQKIGEVKNSIKRPTCGASNEVRREEGGGRA